MKKPDVDSGEGFLSKPETKVAHNTESGTVSRRAKAKPAQNTKSVPVSDPDGRVTLATVLAEVRALRRDLLAESDGLLSVEQASQLALRSEQCIRDWCLKHNIGHYDKRARRYVISKSKLAGFYERKTGLPLWDPQRKKRAQ